MDFVSNQEAQNREMLKSIGISKIEELFQSIPSKMLLKRPFLDDGISEFEGMRFMEALAAKNTFPHYENYLGGGAYEHHVPALVGAICSKSEFLTSYTPYQPEASQGMLQAIFEFQTAMCALTGLDVSNASLYDGASACAEGLLMALRCKKDKQKILVAKSLNPHYRSVVDQYLFALGFQVVEIPFRNDGSLDMTAFEKLMDTETAAVLVQYPNFFGTIDEIKTLSLKAKEKDALTVVCANPLVYGLYASAAEIGADIAVGDCQPFGIPLQFGGPYAGYITCRKELVRQLPGRIVGETVDAVGKRGFVLTLQAREQHIRREKATSNICTNQSLAALASLIAILWYGKEGVRQLALTNFQRTAYLRSCLGKFVISCEPFFNEIVVKFNEPIDKVLQHFRKSGIEPGIDLGNYFPEFKNCLLVAVTETKSKEQIDRYCEVASRSQEPGVRSQESLRDL
jgi:glycine dehydrogenase subunit 1